MRKIPFLSSISLMHGKQINLMFTKEGYRRENNNKNITVLKKISPLEKYGFERGNLPLILKPLEWYRITQPGLE